MDKLGPELLSDHILAKAYPAAVRRGFANMRTRPPHRAQRHRRPQHRGRPLRPLFDDIICSEMVRDAANAGELLGAAHRRVTPAAPGPAETPGVDLRQSVAYADSSSDLPCSKQLGSRSRSIPKPAWRPSQPSVAG
ncbi:MAG: hypothetical protein R2706_17715 [Acidimicrobiales bacterium]